MKNKVINLFRTETKNFSCDLYAYLQMGNLKYLYGKHTDKKLIAK
jgi:hypothetical protein